MIYFFPNCNKNDNWYSLSKLRSFRMLGQIEEQHLRILIYSNWWDILLMQKNYSQINPWICFHWELLEIEFKTFYIQGLVMEMTIDHWATESQGWVNTLHKARKWLDLDLAQFVDPAIVFSNQDLHLGVMPEWSSLNRL